MDGEYWTAAARWLDMLLHREILRMRAAYQLSLDEFRGLYVSDEQVDALVGDALGAAPAELGRQADALREAALALRPVDSAWGGLAVEFGLSAAEMDMVLLAVAPEWDLKYETLYAYLNNDISRKAPTVDLALRLLSASPAERLDLRRLLQPDAPLFAAGLLRPTGPAAQSALAQGFAPAPALARHLLGLGLGERGLGLSRRAFAPSADLTAVWGRFAPGEAERLRRAAALLQEPAGGAPPWLVFSGRAGAGRAAAAWAFCAELGLDLLSVDLAAGEPPAEWLAAALLQTRLRPAGLYLDGLETLFTAGGRPLPDCRAAAAVLAGHTRPVFFACAPEAPWRALAPGRPALLFNFPEPDYDQRRALWQAALAERGITADAGEIQAVAGRFALNAGQINAAAAQAALAGRLDGEPVAALFGAARQQSDARLGQFAAKVEPLHGFADLVLPPATLARLRDLAAAIRNRPVVYAQWGFARRIGAGQGVKALLAGGSGTGKTMAAGAIAQELGLDLYKIDLSGVVSKYIGETEKNLDRIFNAAQDSNAILFFDEADALFGKRSEVKDAHDRYANIEVAYLLQKVEAHEGVVILASNLGKNIDAAFARRLHYAIDFPQPDAALRERLWRGMFPAQTPLAADVDFAFLAKQFTLAGGDIKNVALDAAFLAAADGGVVTMRQLVNAMARQMDKQGRMPTAADFKQYHALIAQG